MYIKINEATNYIKTQYHGKIDLAIILGSGLGPLADEIENPIELDYRDIPHFPISNLIGHAGKLIIGTLENKTVIAMKGRFHYYEGNDMDIVTLPIRVFKRLGIDNLILTNACGGIREDLNPGQIMLIKDHIGLFAPSPLRGPNLDEFGPRFKDMSEVYNRKLGKLAHQVADNNNISLKDGVYAFFKGPMYETPAEILAYRALGADAVLLISAILSEGQMKEYSDIAHELGLECLVEVHNEEEYKKTLGFKPDMLGINNRNLYTFDVDLETTGRLSNIVGDHAVLVSESGIKTNADMKKVRSLGADAVLIGETLMRSGNIGTTLHELREGV